jgi:hypothetical protein
MVLPASVFLLLVGESLLFASDLLLVVGDVVLPRASEPRLLVGELRRSEPRLLVGEL